MSREQDGPIDRIRMAIYLYGFVPPDVGPPPSTLTGIGGGPVELQDLGGSPPAKAAVSHLPDESYSGEALESKLRDLEWVAEHGLEHERVVTWFVDHAQILPARLLTLYTSESALGRAAATRGSHIAGELERLKGLREWDLQVRLRTGEPDGALGADDGELARLNAAIETAAPGRRYLLEKQRARIAGPTMRSAARRRAADLLEAVKSSVVEWRELPPPKEAADAPLILNAALLVSTSAEVAIRESIALHSQELDALGLAVSLSGPWAPYRFVRIAGDA